MDILLSHNQVRAAAAIVLVLALLRISGCARRTRRIQRAPKRELRLNCDNAEVHPYSPFAITPYVLLLSGISTPAIALTNLADALVQKGSRVMFFDYFGRGFSDAPTGINHDTGFYITQILLVLASSEVGWTGKRVFHVVGYSFGGALAMALARYCPDLVRSIIFVAPCGLLRRHHVDWKARLLYSDSWLPMWLRWALLRRRLHIPPSLTTQADPTYAHSPKAKSDATGGPGYNYAFISERTPGITVADILTWQAAHHPGFIDAFISCMINAPIFGQMDLWRSVGKTMSDRRRLNPTDIVGGRVLFILGDSDTGIIKDELIQDARLVLGADGMGLVVMDTAHEIVMKKGLQIAEVAGEFWAGKLERGYQVQNTGLNSNSGK
ncbi:alpha/beta-hydrolase [Apiospora rasikravindrae]|uniref:Alpha/beta-hydrolase n=1 Tax=Apiospora rasikravindrae TaxID=990691 RepID=A0ABR1S2K0_9PEZI